MYKLNPKKIWNEKKERWEIQTPGGGILLMTGLNDCCSTCVERSGNIVQFVVDAINEKEIREMELNMEQLMKIGNPKFYDSVAKTDRYGKSIEHLLSQHPDTEFLIVPSADGWMVSAVSTIKPEEPEIEEENERQEQRYERKLPESGSRKPKDSERKSSRGRKR